MISNKKIALKIKIIIILKDYNFPKNYIPIAILKHPQREEYQTLWKPY